MANETKDKEAKEKEAKEKEAKEKEANEKEKKEKEDKHEDNAQIQTASSSSTMSKSLLEIHQQLFNKIKKAKLMHKSIVKVEKLIKKHKKEFTLAHDDEEKMK